MTTLPLIKSNGPVAFAARTPSHPARVRLLCAFTERGGRRAAAGWGYPGFTTAEGTNALKNLTNGVANTATAWYSLLTNSSGNYNTGVGDGTLIFNNGEQNTATGVAALFKQYQWYRQHGHLKEELKEQRYLIQKVSDKIDVSQSATKVARREP
jgi:hypothetical protein